MEDDQIDGGNQRNCESVKHQVLAALLIHERTLLGRFVRMLFADVPAPASWWYVLRLDNPNLPQQSAPLLSLFSAHLAINLGTVNTRVYARDRGIVVNKPYSVAFNDRTGNVQAVGKEAKEMLGRTPAAPNSGGAEK